MFVQIKGRRFVRVGVYQIVELILNLDEIKYVYVDSDYDGQDEELKVYKIPSSYVSLKNSEYGFGITYLDAVKVRSLLKFAGE